MKNEFLRHTLATIDYRFRKAVNNADGEFGNFTAGHGSRTPTEIVHHMHQVLHTTRGLVTEEEERRQEPLEETQPSIGNQSMYC